MPGNTESAWPEHIWATNPILERRGWQNRSWMKWFARIIRSHVKTSKAKHNTYRMTQPVESYPRARDNHTSDVYVLSCFEGQASRISKVTLTRRQHHLNFNFNWLIVIDRLDLLVTAFRDPLKVWASQPWCGHSSSFRVFGQVSSVIVSSCFVVVLRYLRTRDEVAEKLGVRPKLGPVEVPEPSHLVPLVRIRIKSITPLHRQQNMWELIILQQMVFSFLLTSP
jgi:hypothetical protein